MFAIGYFSTGYWQEAYWPSAGSQGTVDEFIEGILREFALQEWGLRLFSEGA